MTRIIPVALLLVSACDTRVDGSFEVDAGASAFDSGVADAIDAASPDNYEALFPSDRVLDIDLSFREEDWELLMEDPWAEVYIPVTLSYDGVEVPNVGLRLKGNSSRNLIIETGSTRFSFKVDINYYDTEQRLHGIKKLNLNNVNGDPSFLREHLAYTVFRRMGVPASRTAFARITLNGQLHGLYLVVEQVDKDFLEANFGDDSGNLYKPEFPAGDLTWRGEDFDSYGGMELKTNEDAPDHSGLIHALNVLNHATDPEEIATVFDIELAAAYTAVNAILVNLDSYSGSGHNYYLYENPTSGLFVLIPWDTNEAFGKYPCEWSAEELLELSYLSPTCADGEERPLSTRLIGTPSFLATYETAVAESMTLLDPETFGQEVDELALLISPYVEEDPTKFTSFEAFETNIHDDLGEGDFVTFGITEFVRRRLEHLATEMGL